MIDLIKNLLHGVFQHFIDKVYKNPIGWGSIIHKVYEPKIDVAVAFPFLQKYILHS
jgi:hypothetical protein